MDYNEYKAKVNDILYTDIMVDLDPIYLDSIKYIMESLLNNLSENSLSYLSEIDSLTAIINSLIYKFSIEKDAVYRDMKSLYAEKTVQAITFYKSLPEKPTQVLINIYVEGDSAYLDLSYLHTRYLSFLELLNRTRDAILVRKELLLFFISKQFR